MAGLRRRATALGGQAGVMAGGLARAMQRTAVLVTTRSRSSRPGTKASQRRQGGRRPADGVRTPMMATPGFDLVVVAILRDEAAYVEEWLAYHLALGVQHIFLYDNESRDDLRGVLRRAQAHGLVTLIDWPGRGRQFDAYQHAVRLFGPSCAWMAFIDLDEFIVPHEDPDIPTLLARLDGVDQLRLPVREFAFSGHRTPPDDLVLASYTIAHRRVPRYSEPETIRVKSIVRPRAVVEARVHTSRTDQGRTVDPRGRLVAEVAEEPATKGEPFAVAQVNHYYTKSWSEFEQKRLRGSATGRSMRPEVPFDLPDGVEDPSALRFLPATRAMLAELRSLDADPFRYGSRLALPIPRHDGFAPDAGRALGNHVAGLSAPSPNAARSVPMLPDGRGALARADGPSPAGDLSRSVHIGAFQQRLLARVVWDLADDQRDASAWSPESGSLDVDTGEADQPRCQAVVFAATVESEGTIRVETTPGDGGPSRSIEVALPAAGTHLGVVSVHPEPARVRRISVRATARSGRVEVSDLMVLTYA